MNGIRFHVFRTRSPIWPAHYEVMICRIAHSTKTKFAQQSTITLRIPPYHRHIQNSSTGPVVWKVLFNWIVLSQKDNDFEHSWYVCTVRCRVRTYFISELHPPQIPLLLHFGVKGFFLPFHIFSLFPFPGAQTFKIEVDSLEKANELRDVLSKAGFATFEVLASSANKETRVEDAETRKSWSKKQHRTAKQNGPQTSFAGKKGLFWCKMMWTASTRIWGQWVG